MHCDTLSNSVVADLIVVCTLTSLIAPVTEGFTVYNTTLPERAGACAKIVHLLQLVLVHKSKHVTHRSSPGCNNSVMIALQVRAESAATSATAAEAAQAANQSAEDSDTDHAAELYQQAHRACTEASSLQEAVQRALQNTDDIEATAALLCSTDEQDEEASTAQAGCDATDTQLPLLYNVQALQLWLLKCCQAAKGGMRDKPGKPPDYYHTCYCLSGLSSSQNLGGLVLGPASNKLVKADPLCNVVQHKLDAALQFVPIQPEYL